MLRENLYAAKCCVCRTDIAPGKGVWVRLPAGGRRMYCQSHLTEAKADDEVTWRNNGGDDGRAIKQEPEDQAMAFDDTTQPTAPAFDKATLDAAVKQIAEQTAAYFLTHVPGMVETLVPEALLKTVRTLEIKIAQAPKIKVAQAHYMLATVLQAVASGCSPFLVGPAGSGKTTLAQQVATTLGRKFYMAARVTSEFKLVGFVDATGKTVRTQFREAYEHGGVFLFDEVDASDPDALTAFNAALANGVGDFPDGMVKRHKDFIALAAGNTYGRGADRQYVGRNQLDAATLDRFQVFDIDYDEALELALAGNVEWTKYVQSVRKAIDAEKVRHIVSPRASISGAAMLATGMERQVVANATVWKGLPTESRTRVEARMQMRA